MQQVHPTALVDFASALDMLAKSSADITELVTKWYDITDTDTPKTVSIVMSDGRTHEVDNLAKIRNDLTKGLSVDIPNVRGIRMEFPGGFGETRGMYRHGRTWHEAWKDDFDAASGYRSFLSNEFNDTKTVCVPTSNNITVAMHRMPRLIVLGTSIDQYRPILTGITLTVEPPASSTVAANILVYDKTYYNFVTLMNRNSNSSVKVTIKFKGTQNSKTYNVSSGKSIELVMFAAAGGSSVDIQAIEKD